MELPVMSNAKRVALVAAVYLGSFVALLDVSVVNLALPTLQSALKAEFSGLQWVINAYGLCLSALTLSAGVLGDRYGRKRCWLIAVAIFVTGSILCSAATSLPALIVGRVVQGVAGAALLPGALSILTQAFQDPKMRAHVIGGWAAFAALSMVVGPPLGGFLIHVAGWPSIFLINAPLGFLTIALGLWAIPESSDPAHASFDPAGQIVSALWLCALSYGLINIGAEGWGAPATVASLAAAAIGLAVFVIIERRAAHPMLPRALFGDRRFVAIGGVASFALGFAAYGSVFFFSLFLQDGQGLAAAEAGLRMTPFAGVMMIIAAFSGRVASRVGLDATMIAGFAVIGAAMGGMALWDAGSPYWVVAPLLGLMGVGMGLAIPAVSAAAMIAAPRAQSGIASSIVNATRQTGAMVGVALLGSLMSARAIDLMQASLARANAPSAGEIARAVVIGRDLSSVSAANAGVVHGLFAEALVGGFHGAMIASALAALAMAGALLWLRARGSKRAAASVPGE